MKNQTAKVNSLRNVSIYYTVIDYGNHFHIKTKLDSALSLEYDILKKLFTPLFYTYLATLRFCSSFIYKQVYNSIHTRTDTHICRTSFF